MRPAARLLIQTLLVPAIFLLDRATKHWAMTRLEPVGSIPVLPFFHLTYVENTGAAWGMLQGRNVALIGISLSLLAGLLYLRRQWKERPWELYGSTLVIAGAVGNLYDRIAYGYVVDFLDFLVWPVFNVADSCITVGACALAWGMHLADRDARRKAA